MLIMASDTDKSYRLSMLDNTIEMYFLKTDCIIRVFSSFGTYSCTPQKYSYNN